MIPTTTYAYLTLRLGLLISAVGWGVAFSFTFSTWQNAADWMLASGAGHVEYRPIMDYWLRMASVVMGCIGLASLLAARKPASYVPLIRLLGPFHIIVGITLLISAWNNGLRMDQHPTFIPDIIFCFLSGGLIWIPQALASRSK